MRTKILLLFAIFIWAVPESNAQINTGRYLTGGGFNMHNAKYSEPYPAPKVESLNTNIQFGKVIRENTIAGLILSYGYSNYYYSTDAPDSNFSKSNQYNAGVFYRKYKSLLRGFYFFGEADAAYFHRKNKQYFQSVGQGSRSVTNGVLASFNPGISYAVWKRMQIELLIPDIIMLSYSHVKTDYNTTTPPSAPNKKGNIFSVNTNLNSNLLSSFAIGFKFLLGK